MATRTIEERVAILEARLDILQHRFEESFMQSMHIEKRDWRAIVGTFADAPLYEEAMRLGREWRENQQDADDCSSD